MARKNEVSPMTRPVPFGGLFRLDSKLSGAGRTALLRSRGSVMVRTKE
jgi:hypothetical protein